MVQGYPLIHLFQAVIDSMTFHPSKRLVRHVLLSGEGQRRETGAVVQQRAVSAEWQWQSMAEGDPWDRNDR